MNREIKFRFWQPSTQTMQKWEDYQEYGIFEMFKNIDSIPLEYIGLKDKNGKEIYEGDAIRYKNYNGFSVIRYEKCSFFFYGISVIHFLFNVKEKDIEVIGNIYENPEFTQS